MQLHPTTIVTLLICIIILLVAGIVTVAGESDDK